jgi:isopentenyl-diphosphate delta-isomerase
MNANPAAVKRQPDTLILVDEQDKEIGACAKVDCHVANGKLHRAFSVFLFNPDGELLIQQRSSSKMLWPLYWANSCCSHPRLGEDTQDAASRRVQEELGVSCELQYLYKFVYHAQFGTAGSEHENCWVFAGHFDGLPDINHDEISDWRFIRPEELTREIASNADIYTPWLKLEWERIRQEFLADLL